MHRVVHSTFSYLRIKGGPPKTLGRCVIGSNEMSKIPDRSIMTFMRAEHALSIRFRGHLDRGDFPQGKVRSLSSVWCTY
jgi:hypothetical protein